MPTTLARFLTATLMLLCATAVVANLAVAERAQPDGPTSVEEEPYSGSWDAPTTEPEPTKEPAGEPSTTTNTASSATTTTEPTTTSPTTSETTTTETTTQTTGGQGNPGTPSNDPPSSVSPSPPPAEKDDRLLPVRMTDTLPVAAEFEVSPEVIVLAAFVAAVLIMLIAFPAELFNKTYEENATEIHRILAKVGITGGRLPSWWGLGLFLLLSTVLSVLLAGDEGAKGNPVAQVIGFLVAIPVVTFAYGLPAEWYSRGRSRIPGFLEVLTPALVVAVLCAGLSTLLQLNPPYLYGLFIGFTTIRPRCLNKPQEGRAVLAGAACLLACAVAAWFLWNTVHAVAYGDNPTWPAIVADAILFWIFVLATESLVFALPPLRFLDGRRLRDWHVAGWLVPQVLAVAAFTYVFVLRAKLNPPEGGAWKALVFFCVFAALSGLFWLYFQWPGRPSLTAGGSRSASAPGTRRRRSGHPRGPGRTV